MILHVEFLLYRIPQPVHVLPLDTAHPFDNGPGPIAELRTGVTAEHVSRISLVPRWVQSDLIQVELDNMQAAAEDWHAGRVALYYNERRMGPVPFMLYTLPSAVPSFTSFPLDGTGMFSLGMRVFAVPLLPRRPVRGLSITQSSEPTLSSVVAVLSALTTDDANREGPDDDDDHDDFPTAEEWQPGIGQCDNCSGETTDGPFPTTCGCAAGEGAAAEDCVCGA